MVPLDLKSALYDLCQQVRLAPLPSCNLLAKLQCSLGPVHQRLRAQQSEDRFGHRPKCAKLLQRCSGVRNPLATGPCCSCRDSLNTPPQCFQAHQRLLQGPLKSATFDGIEPLCHTPPRMPAFAAVFIGQTSQCSGRLEPLGAFLPTPGIGILDRKVRRRIPALVEVGNHTDNPVWSVPAEFVRLVQQG